MCSPRRPEQVAAVYGFAQPFPAPQPTAAADRGHGVRMKVIKLRIDGQAFFLPAEVDLAALREQILAAVAGPAAFVSFHPVGYGEVTVLVTAHVPIRFEVEEHADSEVEEWTEHPPAIDVKEVFPSY